MPRKATIPEPANIATSPITSSNYALKKHHLKTLDQQATILMQSITENKELYEFLKLNPKKNVEKLIIEKLKNEQTTEHLHNVMKENNALEEQVKAFENLFLKINFNI